MPLYALVVDNIVARTEIHDTSPGPQWVLSLDTGLLAEPGFEYLPDVNQFRTPQPHPSWTYDTERSTWVAPLPRPRTEWPEISRWSEDLQQWQIFNLEQ